MPSDPPPTRRAAASDPVMLEGELHDLRTRVLALEKLPGKIALVEASLQQTTQSLTSSIDDSGRRLSAVELALRKNTDESARLQARFDLARREMQANTDVIKANAAVSEATRVLMERATQSLETSQQSASTKDKRGLLGQVVMGSLTFLLQVALIVRMWPSHSAATPPASSTPPVVIYLPAPVASAAAAAAGTTPPVSSVTSPPASASVRPFNPPTPPRGNHGQ